MKYYSWVLALLFFLAAAVQAQQSAAPRNAVPVDSITQLITYEKVIEVEGATVETLYQRLQDWFHAYYKNPGDVIRKTDPEKHSVTGKHRFAITNPPDKSGLRTDAGLVQYTITVTARQGRYKYELSEFNWKLLSVYPCERWLDTKAAGYQSVYNEYLVQLDKEVAKIISSLMQAIGKEKPVKDKDNW